MNRIACAVALIVWFLMLSGGRAEDWPQFRGPTHQGLSATRGLPIEWSTTKNVAWKQAIPGRGWSSPVLYRGRVYVTSAVPVPEAKGDKPSQSLNAIGLDAATGKVRWNTLVFDQDGATAAGIHQKNSHASPTPLIDDQRLYVHFGHQGTACLDLDGKVVWRTREIKYRPVHGNGGSPVVAGDSLVFSCDGAADPFVVALDRATGKPLWKTPREVSSAKKFSFSTPLVIQVDGSPQVVSPGTDGVVAYAPDTGREIWKVRYEGYSVVPRPVYGHGLVFIATGFNSPRVMAIRPAGRGDVTESQVAWTVRKGAPHTPSLLLVGDELYMVSDRGVATCLDAKTGKPHWEQRLGGNYSASPIYADGKIYFQNEAGGGVVIQAGTTFKRLAESDLAERSLASYAVGDGALFIRTAGHLYRIESKR